MGRVRKWLKRPLAWMVLGELVLVGVFLLSAWHIWQDRHLVNPSVGVGITPRHSNSPASEEPGVQPLPTQFSTATDPSSAAQLIQGLNNQGVTMESAEWQLFSQLDRWFQHYFQEILLPKIDVAERGGQG